MNPTFPILDDAGLKRLYDIGGDRLVNGLIDLFVREAPVRVANALNGSTCGDLDAVHRSAHSLKSTAANFGAVRLSELAGEIEQAAGLQDHARVRQLLTGLEDAYDQTREALVERRPAELRVPAAA
ncbi:MAG: Hpt domain-containing protein [Gemmatimonadota bacterium]